MKVINKKAGDIIFNNPTINITINKTFSTLEGVDQIDGLAIKDNKGNNKFNITRDQFERLYSPNEVFTQRERQSRTGDL